MTEFLSLCATLLLLLGNAFFVGAEFSVITARRDRLEALADAGAKRAQSAINAGKQLPLLIAGAQLGITVCSLALGALAEPLIAGLLARPFERLAIPGALLHGVSFALGLGIVVALHTIIGEMVPKNLAIAGPERAAMALVPVHYAFCRMVRPVLGLFTTISKAVLRLLRVQPKDELESAYTPEELATLIADSRREGLLDRAEHARLAQTLSSADRTVADVVVPLTEVTMVPATPTVGDVQDAVASTGFSRFPIRSGNGAPAGYLHVKDVLEQAGDDPATPVRAARFRPLPQLRADTRLDDALAALRRAQSHMGIAVDSEGAAVGVVALEDLVEEYVGTVRDGTHR